MPFLTTKHQHIPVLPSHQSAPPEHLVSTTGDDIFVQSNVVTNCIVCHNFSPFVFICLG